MKFNMKVLHVDDDKEFSTALSIFLEKLNITTVLAHRISSAEKQLRRSDFDVVLLDVMLPGGSGFEFLPTIRKISDVPVIMLTALDEEKELVNGLDLGADDYITKPFSTKELVARMRAAHRRHRVDDNQTELVLDDLKLFPGQLLAQVGSTHIELTAVETQLLQLLLNASDNYVSRDTLYNRVFQRELIPYDRSLDVHISNLRRKLGPHPSKGNRIKAIRGIGYTLIK